MVTVVEAILLGVDPAPAQRDCHRFGVADTGLGRAALGDLEPEAVRAGVVLAEPGLEGLGGLEQDRRGFGLEGGLGGIHR
ncbi:hypothetical protein ACS5PK_18325 [Roseateles sp. DB2]|uniref:hypothetical protein n=1 Tax=Roseateles sp. DB2 TaxID=3453717 RepID=UPI003EF071DF